MNILFVADPLESFKIHKDTTFVMMREAQKRGHRISACETSDLSWQTGGKGVAQELSARDREIGETLGPVLAARGLLLAGVDVIGDSVTEINVTSPTCFQEIFDQTGFDVAAMFVDALEAALVV